jgi:hypothetical protein
LKNIASVIFAFCMLASFNGAFAQRGPFGAGIIVGEPTGLSAKLWISHATAIDFGIGWSIGGDRIGTPDVGYDGSSRIHFHMDYLLHMFNLFGANERYPFYCGIGGRFNTGGGYNDFTAIRFVTGLAWMPAESPIDIFIEFVPSFQFSSRSEFTIDSGFGARYYF